MAKTKKEKEKEKEKEKSIYEPDDLDRIVEILNEMRSKKFDDDIERRNRMILEMSTYVRIFLERMTHEGIDISDKQFSVGIIPWYASQFKYDIENLREGIRKRDIDDILNYTGLTQNILAGFLHISTKTLQSVTKGKKLKPAPSERALLIRNLYMYGEKVFASREKFIEWMNKKNRYFNNEEPQNFLDTFKGIEMIKDELSRIEYGEIA